MWPSRARRKFPQLSNNDIKYCPVFYEGTHDDARTNLAVAQTAALEGAAVANYCEATALLSSTLGGRVEGATVRDAVSGETFNIRAKSVLLCGGPFTDTLRVMEDPDCKSAVNGASGIHIVLPAYFAPSNIGLVDMSTSDGRFMFFLPWKGHVVVGTTDSPATPTMRPIPAEAEIKWLLHEASKYLSPELKLRRQDVLSAWSGIRPLALDPHASSTAAASRDHVISYNPASGTVFVSGGKWTTFREMAEDAVDKVLATNPLLGAKTPKCRTLQTHFIGFKGYSENLTIRLIQQYDMSARVAEHLASVYGGRAEDVVKIAKELNEQKIANGTNGAGSGSGGALIDVEEDYDESFAGAEALLVPGYPFIEAEVVFAARYDWAVRAEDVLARRTRLAFLNKDAAVRAIPKVVRLMAGELGWSLEQQKAEMRRCAEYLRHFGGSKPLQADTSVRLATHADLLDVFRKAKPSQASGLTRDTLRLAAEMLNHPLSDEEVSDCLLSGGGTGVSGDAAHVPFDAFALWWNSERLNPGLTELIASKMATPQIKGTGVLFG
ncbi:FAD dependent oxidoreductase-domain-containing protein [Ochromonadaceae sp. CCMP2298]|nr:FAD dependent oxidoreductase-domain-containing protein [Ochromonadaceae sp. CCMP2298]